MSDRIESERWKEVCVDACLVVKLVVKELDSDRARSLFGQWVTEHVRLIAPPFFVVEVDSVLRKKAAVRKELTLTQADAAFEAARNIPVELVDEPGARRRAWELAKELDLPVVYDAHYLSLTELRGCLFWTADDTLYQAVQGKIPYIRRLGDVILTSTT